MSKNIFLIMVELQHKFNKQVFEDYLKKGLNWNSAIIAESGELLDSLGYKWWKKQVPDMDNVKVEAIDLLHFVICEEMQRNFNNLSKSEKIDEDYIISAATETFLNYFHTPANSNSFGDLGVLIDLLNYHRYQRIFIMKLIFDKLNMSDEDVYIAYITKNCLNKFRQEHGYKDGTYIKDWNGKEDNVIAFEIANEWGADEELFELLYRDLDTHYNLFVKNKKNILDDIDYLTAFDSTEI